MTRSRKPSVFTRILGIFGELLITAGLIILLFIVWQIWWTDISAHRAQHAAIEALQEEFGGPIGDDIAQPQEGPPPEWTTTPHIGDTLGIMHIPAFGYDYAYTIIEGTDVETILDTGAFGHYTSTALPGQVGNFSTAAHRQTYGAPMLHVDQLKTGDAIVVETSEAFLVYTLIAEEIVEPDATWTIAADPFATYEAMQNGGGVQAPTRRILTITTCHPPFVSNERWIIHAEFDYWTKRADGLPEALIDPDTLGAEESGN